MNRTSLRLVMSVICSENRSCFCLNRLFRAVTHVQCEYPLSMLVVPPSIHSENFFLQPRLMQAFWAPYNGLQNKQNSTQVEAHQKAYNIKFSCKGFHFRSFMLLEGINPQSFLVCHNNLLKDIILLHASLEHCFLLDVERGWEQCTYKSPPDARFFFTTWPDLVPKWKAK